MLTPASLLERILENAPRLADRKWEAKECILEMRDNEYKNWRQTEWVGFYLEFITERVNIPGVAQFKLFVGNTSFNGCAGKNVIDYKTSSSSQAILLNDQIATKRVVKKYGELGYVVVKGDIENEEENELDLWRQEIAGKSKYVTNGESKGRTHRKLKTMFYPTHLMYLGINKSNIKHLSNFRQGVNSNGQPRNPKYMIPNQKIPLFLRAVIDLRRIP